MESTTADNMSDEFQFPDRLHRRQFVDFITFGEHGRVKSIRLLLGVGFVRWFSLHLIATLLSLAYFIVLTESEGAPGPIYTIDASTPDLMTKDMPYITVRAICNSCLTS
jgi:hypothetical protein